MPQIQAVVETTGQNFAILKFDGINGLRRIQRKRIPFRISCGERLLFITKNKKLKAIKRIKLTRKDKQKTDEMYKDLEKMIKQ